MNAAQSEIDAVLAQINRVILGKDAQDDMARRIAGQRLKKSTWQHRPCVLRHLGDVGECLPHLEHSADARFVVRYGERDPHAPEQLAVPPEREV